MEMQPKYVYLSFVVEEGINGFSAYRAPSDYNRYPRFMGTLPQIIQWVTSEMEKDVNEGFGVANSGSMSKSMAPQQRIEIKGDGVVPSNPPDSVAGMIQRDKEPCPLAQRNSETAEMPRQRVAGADKPFDSGAER